MWGNMIIIENILNFNDPTAIFIPAGHPSKGSRK